MSEANDESSRKAATSTVGLESGGPAAACLTDEQRRQIRQAAQAAYDKLRWHLGDSRELMGELLLMARDSFLEGMRQERSNNLGNRRAAFGASVLTDGLAGKRTE